MGKKKKSSTPESSRESTPSTDGQLTLDEICEFFLSLTGNSRLSQKIKEKGVQPEYFHLFDKEDYTGMGFSPADAQVIMKHKNNIKRSEVPTKPGKKDQQIRKFLHPAVQDEEQLYYTAGHIIRSETSSVSVLDRTIEFKAIQCESLEDMEATFAKKVGKFVIGCMNSRTNGTIFLGVLDGKQGKGQHGEVAGVPLPYSQRNVVAEWMDKYFFLESPKLFYNASRDYCNMIRMCVKAPQLVPIAGNRDRCVIEIDVQPTFDICKNEIFFMRECENKEVKELFIRHGTMTQKVAQKDRQNFEDRVALNARERKRQEDKLLRGRSQNVDTSLNQLLCRGLSKLNDAQFQYVLVIDEMNETSYADFTWLSKIRWEFVLDFDSRKNGLLQSLQTISEKENLFWEPNIMTTKNLKVLMSDQEKFRDNLNFGMRTTWIKTNHEDPSFANWISNRGPLNNLLLQFTSCEAVGDSRRFIFVFLINRNNPDSLAKFSETIKDIRSNTDSLETDQLLFLFTDEKCRTEIITRVKFFMTTTEWEENCLTMSNWNYLKNYMEKKIEMPRYTGKKIPSGSGESGVDLETNKYQEYRAKCLSILAMNECEEIVSQKKSEAEKVEEAKMIIRNFFSGQPTEEWDKFFYSFDCPAWMTKQLLPGIVERGTVADLVINLKEIINIEINDPQRMVELLWISHQPGSGATTIGQHALWNIRHEMRCAVVNASAISRDGLKQLANNIISLRDYKESEEIIRCNGGSNPAPVIIMLDNSDIDTPPILQEHLLAYFKRMQIESSRVQIIIVFLTSTNASINDLQSQKNHKHRNHFHIIHRLSEKEESDFRIRLQELIAQNIPPETVLSFVIMANNFDEQSKYVQNVVRKSLDSIELYPKAQKLLTYLALLKVFRPLHYQDVHCFGLPTKFCQKFLDYKRERHPCSFLQMVPSQAQLFLSETNNNNRGHHDTYIHVPQMPTAKQLLLCLCKDEDLPETVSALLDLMKDPLNDAETHKMFRFFLIRRNPDEKLDDDNLMELFSPLVTKILDKSGGNYTDIIKILTAAYKILKRENKSYLAQVLSKIYRLKKDYSEAEKWAKAAIADYTKEPGFQFPFFDTLGQVYKSQLDQMLRTVKQSDFDVSHLHPWLKIAKKAKDQFSKAQEDYAILANEPRYSHVAGDTPAILGEVYTYMLVIQLILKTTSFSNKKTTNLLITFLQEPTRQNLLKITSNQAIQCESFGMLFKENKEFLTDLYSRTKSRLINATRKMSLSVVRMSDLEKNTELFSEFFGENILDNEWRNIIESKKQPEDKIKELRGYILCISLNNFSWNIKRGIDLLRSFMEIIQETDKLLSGTWDSEFAVCYVTVYMALLYHNYDRITLDENRVKIFISKLLDEMLKKPKNNHSEIFELCNFFLMLNWPMDSMVPDSIQDRCSECLNLLKKLQTEAHSTSVNQFWFQVQAKPNRQRWTQHLESLKPKHGIRESRMKHGAKIFNGKLHGQEVLYEPPGFNKPIYLQKPFRSRNISGTLVDVKFSVIFTALGPVANNIEKCF